MLKRKALNLIIMIQLIVAPVWINRWLSERDWRQDARDDELAREYECEPPTKCVADFNGDGMSDRVDILQTHPANRADWWLVVLASGQELLRLPYDHIDNTLRTHTAIRAEFGKSRLLVYDGASHRPALKASYAWNGEKLIEVPPSELDREILSAMAAHDDSGGWNDRVVRELYGAARLILIYILFAIVVGVTLYRKYRIPKLP